MRQIFNIGIFFTHTHKHIHMGEPNKRPSPPPKKPRPPSAPPPTWLMHVLSCPRGICVRLNVFDKVSLLTRRRCPSLEFTHSPIHTHTLKAWLVYVPLCVWLQPCARVSVSVCVWHICICVLRPRLIKMPLVKHSHPLTPWGRHT